MIFAFGVLTVGSAIKITPLLSQLTPATFPPLTVYSSPEYSSTTVVPSANTVPTDTS